VPWTWLRTTRFEVLTASNMTNILERSTSSSCKNRVRGLLFCIKYGGNAFLRDRSKFLIDCMKSHPRGHLLCSTLHCMPQLSLLRYQIGSESCLFLKVIYLAITTLYQVASFLPCSQFAATSISVTMLVQRMLWHQNIKEVNVFCRYTR
jgi:hypothetical protein